MYLQIIILKIYEFSLNYFIIFNLIKCKNQCVLSKKFQKSYIFFKFFKIML